MNALDTLLGLGAFIVLVYLALALWCIVGFYVTDKVMGEDVFFNWIDAAPLWILGFLYATLWPVWIVLWYWNGKGR